MGLNVSFEGKRYLYFISFATSKLFIFDCESREFKTYKTGTLWYHRCPLTMECISGLDNCIYVLGGRMEEQKINSENGRKVKTKLIIPEDKALILDLNRINDPTQETLVSYFDKLPEARYNHLLVATTSCIYLIGGVVDEKKTRSCLKFITKTKEYVQISDFIEDLNQPSGIAINDETMYLFDTEGVSFPKIYKYEATPDKWEAIKYEKGFDVPLKSHFSAFLTSPNTILVVGGRELDQYGYVYNIKENKTSYQKSFADYKKNHSRVFRQGDVNYCDEEIVYDILDENIFVYDKKKHLKTLLKFNWDRKEDKENGSSNWCSSRH